jgi:hypothetical protein
MQEQPTTPRLARCTALHKAIIADQKVQAPSKYSTKRRTKTQ